MKFRIALVIIFSITLFFSCDSSSTSPENADQPKLSLSPTSLSFSRDNDEFLLIITNSGNDELSWHIVDKPYWIDVSKASGQITTEADTVIVIANTNLDVGEYSGEINLDSNGGTGVVNISLSIEHKIEIFPGLGAAKMKLGDTYSELKQVYGNYDSMIRGEFYYPSDGHYEYMYFMTYNSIKAKFIIFSYSSSINENNTIISIEVEAPYDGLTEKLIGIGSSLNDVVVAYGEPSEIVSSYTNYYKYEPLSTVFYYDEGNTLVTKIRIYNPIHFPGI